MPAGWCKSAVGRRFSASGNPPGEGIGRFSVGEKCVTPTLIPLSVSGAQKREGDLEFDRHCSQHTTNDESQCRHGPVGIFPFGAMDYARSVPLRRIVFTDRIHMFIYPTMPVPKEQRKGYL